MNPFYNYCECISKYSNNSNAALYLSTFHCAFRHLFLSYCNQSTLPIPAVDISDHQQFCIQFADAYINLTRPDFDFLVSTFHEQFL